MFSFQPGSTDRREPERRRGQHPERPDLTDIGLNIFLCSLSIVFISAVFGYLNARSSQEVWESPWTTAGQIYTGTATLLLILSHACLCSARRREWSKDARRWVAYALFATMGYGLFQTLLWIELSDFVRSTNRMEYAVLFLLTSLHGLHVLGGFVAQAMAWWRIGHRHGPATESGTLNRLVKYSAFLLGMWALVIFSLIA